MSNNLIDYLSKELGIEKPVFKEGEPFKLQEQKMLDQVNETVNKLRELIEKIEDIIAYVNLERTRLMRALNGASSVYNNLEDILYTTNKHREDIANVLAKLEYLSHENDDI